MITRWSPSLWEWGTAFSLFPQRRRESNLAYGELNYSHKKMQFCLTLKNLAGTTSPCPHGHPEVSASPPLADQHIKTGKGEITRFPDEGPLPHQAPPLHMNARQTLKALLPLQTIEYHSKNSFPLALDTDVCFRSGKDGLRKYVGPGAAEDDRCLRQPSYQRDNPIYFIKEECGMSHALIIDVANRYAYMSGSNPLMACVTIFLTSFVCTRSSMPTVCPSRLAACATQASPRGIVRILISVRLAEMSRTFTSILPCTGFNDTTDMHTGHVVRPEHAVYRSLPV